MSSNNERKHVYTVNLHVLRLISTALYHTSVLVPGVVGKVHTHMTAPSNGDGDSPHTHTHTHDKISSVPIMDLLIFK